MKRHFDQTMRISTFNMDYPWLHGRTWGVSLIMDLMGRNHHRKYTPEQVRRYYFLSNK